jgi:tricorn protease
MRKFAVTAAILVLCLFVASQSLSQTEKPTLFQKPALNKTHVVFVYGGDLWRVPREGGEAERLTTGVGVEVDPIFSPDGSQIAFTGEYDGNMDVYVVPAGGGVPKRLTYHPSVDVAVGWTPDSKQILFRSGRASYSGRFNKLFTIAVDGVFPAELPLPMGEEGSFSPDGKRLAYVPFWNRRPVPYAYISWKRYRGGLAPPIWIANLADSSIEKLPREKSNDFNPMWVGNRIYFLSDRNGPVSLFAYDTGSKRVTPLIKNDGLEIKSAQAGPGAIVYEQFGTIYLFDLNSGATKKVNIRLTGDLPSVRPRFERVAGRATNGSLSPAGKRAVFEARGEIFSVPAEKGDVRNLTSTPGVAERYPSWSPDGKWIAYFSDESGEYALHLREQIGLGDVKKISLGNPPSFFYSPVWSPDSKKIAYHDKRLNLWYVEIEKSAPVKVDTNYYDHPERSLNPHWSPDSKWLAYTKRLRSQLHAVFVYSLDTGKSAQLTDGMSDARYPQFDASGKYLFFAASTDVAQSTGWLDMSAVARPVTRSVYVAVLKKDLPSPLAPESDEEKVEELKPAEKKEGAPEQKPAEGPAPAGPPASQRLPAASATKEPPKVVIDLEGISQRILSLPLPARTYVFGQAGKAGVLFIAESPTIPLPGQQGVTIHKFELDKRRAERFLEGVTFFAVSQNGEKCLYRLPPDRWFIAGTAQTPRPNEGAIRLDGMEMRVEPRAEWAQMYREVWRIQRDFLYDPGAHGLDLKAAEKKYSVYLDAVAHRADLNYLFDEMLSELSLGHTYVAGGDTPQARNVPGGLLGADYAIESGRYRFARVYDGENWNPTLRAPLTQPGVNVKAGEYLLAVNGRDLRASDNIYAAFESTANRSVVIKVGPNPDGKDAREVTVVPVASEGGLRSFAWIEGNRRKVDEMTGGRVAYVYMPNTGGPGGGWTFFNRYFFAQVGREGVIVDERFNGGGLVADYVIDALRRPLLSYWHTREGADFTTPFAAIFGPKAMIINEFAGSGGDAMPWMFRRAGIGPLIGKRTWGGLVGIYDYPQLVDGGSVTAPRLAFWNPDGTWDVENNGVAPDIEVELDPKAVREGRDPQLERAIQVVMDALKKNPLPKHQRPAYPNYHKK